MAQIPIQTTPSVDMSAGQANEFSAPKIEPIGNTASKQIEQIEQIGKEQLGLAKVMVGLQNQIDDTKTDEKINALVPTLDDIANKYSQLSGKTAFDATPAFHSEIAKAVQANAGEFDNDIQKTMYMSKAVKLQNTAISGINRHSAQQFKVYDTNESKAGVINMANQMAQSWQSRGQIDKDGNPIGDYAMYEGAAMHGLEGYANKIGVPVLNDKGEVTETFKALKREMIDEPVAISVTQSMMTSGNYNGAKNFLNQQFKSGNLDAKSFQALNDNVTTAAMSVDAERVAGELFAGHKVASSVTFQPPLLSMPEISSHFGHREAPIPGASTEHNGIDLPAPKGTPVYAAGDGVVKKAWNDETGGGGNSVVLDHINKMQTGYAHLDRYAVQDGQHVKQGDLIGYVGSTGRATGSHLHFTVTGQDGQKINPEQLQYGVAMGTGKVISGPQTPQEKQDVIDRIADPKFRKMAQAEFNRLNAQQEAAEREQAKVNFQNAQDIAFSGDGNQWQQVAKNNPALWNALKPEQQTALMNGRPKGDDPDTMLKLLADASLWKPDKLPEFRHLLSESTYQRFYAKGSAPDADDNIRSATFDSDMFNATMNRNNLSNLSSPKTDEDKQESIKLQDKFKSVIDMEQVNRKRQLSRDEKQAILDNIMMDKARVPGALWGSNEVRVYNISPEDAKEAFVLVNNKPVKLSSIPSKQRELIYSKLNARGIRPTEEQIAALWIQAGKPQ